ncbi:MAG: glycoside hydrolase family 125 protein [Eubacteriales bacterium]|nr:glycoside hydrolase family 125 protein [Eubacteriales bacterium]
MDLDRIKQILRDYAYELQARVEECGAAVPGVVIPKRLIEIFPNLFMDTIDTTCRLQADGRVFLITGDIEAMWLRDSTAQVSPYLDLMAESADIAKLIRGLIDEQLSCIIYDPYANAFNETENGRCWSLDEPKPLARVWEQKYEIDSLCYPLRLARFYYQATADRSLYRSPLFVQALKKILTVFATEQRRSTSSYYFNRPGAVAQDTLSHGGWGAAVAEVGLIFSGFRPSDDACVYGYHIADNLFAKKELTELSQTLCCFEEFDGELLDAIDRILSALSAGLEQHATIDDPIFGEIYAYEVDGAGNFLFMDDANVPSLMALPYLSICKKSDPLYRRTRAALLSKRNPYYYEGLEAMGIGSPHTPADYIWPIGLCTQALTSEDPEEINRLLRMICQSEAGTGYMHEGFHKDDARQFTRAWFAWANSLAAYLLQTLILGDEMRIKF